MQTYKHSPSKVSISSLVCHYTANLREFSTLALAEKFPENGTDSIVGLRYIHGDTIIIKGNPEFNLKRKKAKVPIKKDKKSKAGGSVKNGMSLRVRIPPSDTDDASTETLPNGSVVQRARYVTANVFAKGSINITGAIEYEHTPHITRDIVYQYIETTLGLTMDEYSSLHVSNIIAQWDLNVFIINRNVISTMARYGLVAVDTKRGVKVSVPLPDKMRTSKATFHRTGKILCCAFQNFDEICYTYDVINHIVSECYSTLVTVYKGSLSLRSGRPDNCETLKYSSEASEYSSETPEYISDQSC